MATINRQIFLDWWLLVLVFLCLLIGSVYSDTFIDVVTHPQGLMFLFVFSFFLVWRAMLLLWSPTKLIVSTIDILLLIYVGILLWHTELHKVAILQTTMLLSPLVFFLGRELHLLIINRLKYLKISYFIICGVLAFMVLQGVLQYCNLFPFFNSSFRFTGCFLNPGLYSIALVMLLPFCFHLIIEKQIKLIVKVLMVLLFFTALFLIVASESRTSWIAMALSLWYYINNHFKLLKKFREKALVIKVWSIVALLFLTFVVGVFFYRLKPQSAFGRTLIWERSIKILLDQPFGAGNEKFAFLYNEYKDVFYANPNNVEKFALFEGNVNYAFNDLLQIGIEYGLIAVLVLIILLYYGFKKKRREPEYILLPYRVGIVALLFASLSSYPLQVLPLSVWFFFFLGVVVEDDSVLVRCRLRKHTTILIVIIFLSLSSVLVIYMVKQKQAYTSWKQAYAVLYSTGIDGGLTQYQKLYPCLGNDKYFMYNYGCEMLRLGRLNEGLKILKETSTLLNDEDVLMRLGEAYEDLESYYEAIASFEKASRIAPHLFYPRYRLISLYYGIGEEQKAIATARALLCKPIKVPSEKVDKILSDTEAFLLWLQDG